MAVGKEIRTKVKSVQNTQKITSAMEMVAASKMRKAQDRMAASRPYAEKIRNVIHHMAHSHPEYKRSYMQERETKRIGFIIVTSDRGLCGGLNANLFRATLKSMQAWDAKGIGIDEDTGIMVDANLHLEVFGSRGVTVINSVSVTGSNYSAIPIGDNLRFNNMRVGVLPVGARFSIRRWSILSRDRPK